MQTKYQLYGLCNEQEIPLGEANTLEQLTLCWESLETLGHTTQYTEIFARYGRHKMVLELGGEWVYADTIAQRVRQEVSYLFA